MLSQISAEVHQLKDMSLAGYVKNFNTTRTNLIVNMEDSDAFKGAVGTFPPFL